MHNKQNFVAGFLLRVRFALLTVGFSFAFSPQALRVSLLSDHLPSCPMGISCNFAVTKAILSLRCAIPSEQNINKFQFQETFQFNRRVLIASGLTVTLGHKWGNPVWADNLKQNIVAGNAALPVEFNELDPEAANILRHDSAKSGVDVTDSDNVFVFRGSNLLKTNRDGAIRYFAR
jgi:hypothetical protein